MKKVFLFSKTDAVVVPSSGSSATFIKAVESALDRTVIVETPSTIGAGAIVGDKVVTSLLFVANVREVFIRFSHGKKMLAFVTRHDTCRNLAEIVPSSRALICDRSNSLASSPEPRVGSAEALGDPLLVVNVGTGVPKTQAAGMRYVTSFAPRFEERIRMNPNAPRGFVGGGVWNISGELVGLSIGEKIYPNGDIPSEKFSRGVYALPGRDVMDFAESSQ